MDEQRGEKSGGFSLNRAGKRKDCSRKLRQKRRGGAVRKKKKRKKKIARAWYKKRGFTTLFERKGNTIEAE